MLLSIKTVFTGSNTLADYNYSGSKRWTGRERQLFRRAWRANRKQFQFLKTTVSLMCVYTVEPPNSGRVGTFDVVPYSEVEPYTEVVYRMAFH